MPCYRCSARQTDPDRGASPWRRGVVGGEQVLVCPACQAAYDWRSDLDRCEACGAAELGKRLGIVTCRGCGFEAQAAGGAAGRAPGLADDVAEAIERTFRPQRP